MIWLFFPDSHYKSVLLHLFSEIVDYFSRSVVQITHSSAAKDNFSRVCQACVMHWKLRYSRFWSPIIFFFFFLTIIAFDERLEWKNTKYRRDVNTHTLTHKPKYNYFIHWFSRRRNTVGNTILARHHPVRGHVRTNGTGAHIHDSRVWRRMQRRH